MIQEVCLCTGTSVYVDMTVTFMPLYCAVLLAATDACFALSCLVYCSVSAIVGSQAAVANAQPCVPCLQHCSSRQPAC